MTRTISAAGSREDVLRTLRALKVGSEEPTFAKLIDALADHVETDVDAGNRHVEVSVSIGAKFDEG
jgi:hypothetical protein